MAARLGSAATAQFLYNAHALLAAGRLTEADRLYRQLLKQDRSSFDAMMGLARVCGRSGKAEDAAIWLRKATQQRPGSADAHADLGLALGTLGRVDDAIGRFETALRLRPDCFRSLCNLGSLLAMQNRLEEAIAVLDRAVAIRPAEPFPRWHRGIALLMLGRFEEAWGDYDARPMPASEPSPAPQWRGERDLAGKTLLLRAEQGMGDIVQFARFAPLLEGMGARVVLEAHEPLLPLLREAAGLAGLHPLLSPLPPHDLQCRIMSLPGHMWAGVASIPPAPYLTGPRASLDAWRAKLGNTGGKRIGIAWSGNPTHHNDRNRSMPLTSLQALLDTPGFSFVVLQKDVKEEDRRWLEGRANVVVAGPGFRDLADAAGAVGCCDLVISVDTAIVHVAGAAGHPTWIMLPFCPDWRWMLDRSDTPWYPSVRLFRQGRPGHWAGVVDEIVRALTG